MNKSTIKSTIMGKAYEYACMLAINEIVGVVRPVEIVDNASWDVAQKCFAEISDSERDDMVKSARAGVKVIVQMEPKIIEDGNDKLTISLQPDNIARTGDIRDIIIIRRSIKWEIGISVKHNHAALKHSRLSPHIDFGEMWFGVPCSSGYFDAINPIFDYLTALKHSGYQWNQVADKEDTVYVPLLKAFIDEFRNLFETHSKKITAGIIQYLLGSDGKDYYKLIHHNNHKTTVMPFNIHGTLNQATDSVKPQIIIPKIKLPTRIIELCFKEHSKTTVNLTMDNGWAISFRIHNASTMVEPSLKFDIQLLGQPADMFYVDTVW